MTIPHSPQPQNPLFPGPGDVRIRRPVLSHPFIETCLPPPYLKSFRKSNHNHTCCSYTIFPCGLVKSFRKSRLLCFECVWMG